MKYSRIKGLDKDISKLVFGTATPKLFAAVATGAGKKEENEAFELLDEIFSAGINAFGTEEIICIFNEKIIPIYMCVDGGLVCRRSVAGC